MTTFRKIIGNINATKEPSQQSSLELWFESVLDIPIDELTVEDLCCSVRQKVCLEQLMPRILVVLTENPLAGEYYDGELIASLSTINKDDLKNKKDVFVKIKDIINNLNIENLNNDLQDHILKIKKITL